MVSQIDFSFAGRKLPCRDRNNRLRYGVSVTKENGVQHRETDLANRSHCGREDRCVCTGGRITRRFPRAALERDALARVKWKRMGMELTGAGDSRAGELVGEST